MKKEYIPTPTIQLVDISRQGIMPNGSYKICGPMWQYYGTLVDASEPFRERLVTAVNSHDDMLKVLEQVYERLLDREHKPGSFENPLPTGIIFETITKAKGVNS